MQQPCGRCRGAEHGCCLGGRTIAIWYICILSFYHHILSYWQFITKQTNKYSESLCNQSWGKAGRRLHGTWTCAWWAEDRRGRCKYGYMVHVSLLSSSPHLLLPPPLPISISINRTSRSAWRVRPNKSVFVDTQKGTEPHFGWQCANFKTSFRAKPWREASENCRYTKLFQRWERIQEWLFFFFHLATKHCMSTVGAY